jgi:general secretion pathway protein I
MPDSDLSADQLFARLAGASSGDPQELIAMLMGGGATGAATGGAAPSAGTSTNPLAGMMTGMLQQQLTALGETLKKSFREMRFTVSWLDGKATHEFTVTTHLLVLNPRAPNNARGDNPEVPPNLAASAAATAAAAAAQQVPANQSKTPGGTATPTATPTAAPARTQ